MQHLENACLPSIERQMDRGRAQKCRAHEECTRAGPLLRAMEGNRVLTRACLRDARRCHTDWSNVRTSAQSLNGFGDWRLGWRRRASMRCTQLTSRLGKDQLAKAARKHEHLNLLIFQWRVLRRGGNR